MVDTARLVDIDDLRQDYPDLGFSGRRTITLRGGELLVADPVYVADVYNEPDDPVAAYLREHAVVVADFGGDTSSSVYWMPPFLFMPISAHLPDDYRPPKGTRLLFDEIGCDSGSFMFLPMDDTPESVTRAAHLAVREEDAALLTLPPGKLTFFYEQHDPPRENEQGLYRNIVARLERGK